MRIIYAFPNNIYSYDCAKCGGVCCNLNSSLLFKKSQSAAISNFSILKEYINYGEDFVELVCGKKCWFLKNNHCTLKEENKPLGCRIYPVNMWKLADDIIVAEIIPCNHLSISKKTGIMYSHVTDMIIDFDNSFGISTRNFCDKVVHHKMFNANAQIDKYEKWKLNFINDIKSQKENEQDKIIKMLFIQIVISPILFFAQLDNYDEIYRYYLNNYYIIKNMELFDNIYNYYVVISNNTIKFALYKYYFPSNKKIYDELSIINKKKYRDLYYNIKKNILDQEALYDKFFKSIGTKWSVI